MMIVLSVSGVSVVRWIIEQSCHVWKRISEMPDITPSGLETSFTRADLLHARDLDARRIRLADSKGRKQAVIARCNSCLSVSNPVVVDRGLWEAYVTGDDRVQDLFPTLPAFKRDVLLGSRTGKYLCSLCLGEE